MSHSWPAGPCDPAELLYWQLDKNSYLNFQHYNTPLIEDIHSVTAQTLPPSQQEPSCFGRSLSRDQPPDYIEQHFNHIIYAPPAESAPQGTPTSFAPSPGPDAIDQDRGPHWAQSGIWDGSLVPFELQVSNGYGSSSPVQSTALSDFEPSADLVADFSEMMQAQHAQVQPLATNTCQQCNERFENKTTLDDHAKQTQHGTYACICGEPFSRFDCLNRHLDKFNPRELHPCLYCSRYSGSNGFHRRDKLTQHLRTFHKHTASDGSYNPRSSFLRSRPAGKSIPTCPHVGCRYYPRASAASSASGNSQQFVFRTQKEFTKHLREVHNESHRISGKGCFKKKDLLKHQLAVTRQS